MKKHFYLFAMILAMSAFTLNAKADTTTNNDSGGIVNGILDWLGLGGSSASTTPASPTCGQAATTALPIDRGILFLTIAGVSVGFLAIKKAKMGATPTKG